MYKVNQMGHSAPKGTSLMYAKEGGGRTRAAPAGGARERAPSPRRDTRGQFRMSDLIARLTRGPGECAGSARNTPTNCGFRSRRARTRAPARVGLSTLSVVRTMSEMFLGGIFQLTSVSGRAVVAVAGFPQFRRSYRRMMRRGTVCCRFRCEE
ncbi:hypothetical protein EVAR_7207_1 [Eumeta japonica]|uniref:Uncharacterized protein n=1 Tax=Eumeta variegata TaxID=151549 RepID=A0A4C1T375_EUMVA|nr:hypothetical protein EVAR_7207_1 [Eumeta japonica]